MSEQPRNWDKELADIDKAIAKQGSGPPGSPPAAAPAPRVTPAAAPVRRSAVALTWFWVALAVGLAAALALWPYTKGCGLRLGFFLGAVGLTALVGLLSALASWSHRRGFAHFLSLLVLLWAGAAAAREVLPRIGYARQSLTWLCPVGQPAPGTP